VSLKYSMGTEKMKSRRLSKEDVEEALTSPVIMSWDDASRTKLSDLL
jgi:hypothetical protein